MKVCALVSMAFCWVARPQPPTRLLVSVLVQLRSLGQITPLLTSWGCCVLLPHAVSPVLIASMANIAALAAVLPVGGPATILASTMADAEVFVLDAADLVMGVGSAVDMSRVDDATVHERRGAAHCR
jgi:hypothetical protein